MASPPNYTPVHTFVSDSATLANFPGQQLDVEFNDVKATTDAIITNLNLLQRGDGAPANGTVTYDTLSPTLQTNGLATASAWLTAVSYAVGTTVYQNSNLYRCLVAHTSGVFATDLAAAKWLLLVALPTSTVPGPANTLTIGTVTSGAAAATITGSAPNQTLNLTLQTGTTGNTGSGYGGTSATSLLLANSVTKVFTTQAGLAYQVGSYVRASSAANGANFMEGLVSAYSGTSLSIAVSNIGGSGTFADWGFATAGIPGSVGVGSIAGNTGAFTLGAGLKNSINIILADPAYHRGYISGLTLSNDGVTPNTVLDIAPGVSTSDDASTMMLLASAYTKTTGTWVVGTGNGALDTGSIGAASWYHVFLIERTDTLVTDILFSLSATAPTMPTSYTKKRRIGSFKTAASNIVAFTQVGQKFYWSAPVFENGAAFTVGTSRLTITLTGVPTGVVVDALASMFAGNGAAAAIWVGPLFVTDAAPALGASPGATIYTGVSTTASITGGPLAAATNTSAQIASRSSVASSSLTLFTTGWLDYL